MEAELVITPRNDLKRRVLKFYRTNDFIGNVRTQAGLVKLELEARRRRQKYRSVATSELVDPRVFDNLDQLGYSVIPGLFERARLIQLRDELNEAIAKGGSVLNRATRDSAREDGDLRGASEFLTPDEVKRGQEYLRLHTNYVSVAEPLVSCPSSIVYAFDKKIIDIAQHYLSCPPALGGLNLRKSFVNELADFDTLYFHSDPNSLKFLKFFLYLNDVDQDGGPFCYVKGSHKKKFKGWRTKYRWTHEEIEKAYGSEQIVYITGEIGDLIVANTTGFHRGTKVKSQDRHMLTIDYVIDEEFGGQQARPKIKRSTVDSLTPRQRVATDFLEALTET